MSESLSARQASRALVARYYLAFNEERFADLVALLTADVVHDINQGGRDVGISAFTAFLARMARCYRERVSDVLYAIADDGAHVAAEFTVQGTYLATDPGLPEARGQTYALRVCAFFAIDVAAQRIARVSTHYNLADWLKQIS